MSLLSILPFAAKRFGLIGVNVDIFLSGHKTMYYKDRYICQFIQVLSLVYLAISTKLKM